MANKETRITKAVYFANIKAALMGEDLPNNLSVDDMVAFIDKETALLAKKNATGTGKLTATQEANEKYKEQILDFLAEQEKPVTCTEVKSAIPDLQVYENQKVAALLRQLKEAQKIDKKTVKGKSVFFLL